MRVLFIHSVPQFGGASRSLCELVLALRDHDVEPIFVSSSGSVNKRFEKISSRCYYAKKITAFNNTRTGYYSSFRWLVLTRELLSIPGTLVVFKRAYREVGEVDILHVNEVIDLPSALIARLFFKAPIVVHLRTSFRNDSSSLRSRVITRALRKYPSAIIAIDENTRSTLPADLEIDVIHNSLHVSTETSCSTHAKETPDNAIVVGYVGNMLYSKGIILLIEAIRNLRAAHKNVRLEVVGGGISGTSKIKNRIVRWFGVSDDASESVAKIIKDYDLQDCVTLHGHIDDLGAVYPMFDVLAFPSIFDSPGRPIFEAALYGVPSIACLSNPKPDTFVDGETGIALSSPNLPELEAAISILMEKKSEVVRMGENAQRLAQRNCNPWNNARKVKNIYTRVISKIQRSKN